MNGKKAKALRKLAGYPGRSHKGRLTRSPTGALTYAEGTYKANVKDTQARLGTKGDDRATLLWHGMRNLPDMK